LAARISFKVSYEVATALGAGRLGAQIGGNLYDLVNSRVESSNNSNAAGNGSGNKVDALVPGPNAGEAIPARGPDRDFTQGERDKINEIGQNTGCHTCGATDPGTKSGNHIPDHQPPNALNPNGGQQQLLPHCINCSRVQGGQVRQETRKKPPPPPPKPEEKPKSE
jgi:hypothetical protein